jgi:hypothetical protein
LFLELDRLAKEPKERSIQVGAPNFLVLAGFVK